MQISTKWARFLAPFLLFILSTAHITAQDISLNVPVSGALASGETVSYRFIAREGAMLSFLVRADASLDPVLSIQNNSGFSLISNDDYNYPTSRNALIEGFYAPYNGSYTVSISAFGTSQGAYELTMFSGYSTISFSESFDEGSQWQVLNIAENAEASFNVVNGTANLSQTGIEQTALVVANQTVEDAYYIDARIDSITGARGWEVGLAFKVQDAANYYRMLINNNGSWQVSKFSDGIETVLRDWIPHPAIRVGATRFALGILINGNGYDFFYDDTFIGNAYDTSFDSGQVGLTITTGNAIGSEVVARYDSLTITSPTLLNDAPLFPNQLVAAGMNGTIRELERRFLIPTGGTMAFTIPESFAQNNREGVSVFPMGNGNSFSNFALGVSVSWAASGADLNACGIVLRDSGTNHYVLAYVDSEGAYGLSEREDSAFIQNTFNERIELQRPPYQLLLIANNTRIEYFINGSHALGLDTSLTAGTMGEAVVNFEAVNTNCQFNNLWLWQW